MVTRPLRIMIAWRPGEYGTETLAYAGWLARTTNVQIRVVSVLSRGWPLTNLARLVSNDSWVANETESLLAIIKSELKLAGLRKGMLDEDSVRVIETSNEAQTICHEAEEFGADMVLVGTRRNHAKDWSSLSRNRFIPGSTADALLHYSPVPLGLAVPGAKLSKHGITRVNVCYIDTPQSHIALNKAADCAHRWQVPLRLVSFTPRGATMYPTENGYGTSSDLMVEWREQAMGLLDRGSDRAHTRYPDLTVDIDVASGNGWDQAINSIKWKKGDLLVLGSSSLGQFGRIFIGTSTVQIVRHSPIPMLITPA